MKNSRGYVLVIVLIAVLLCATLTIILFERGRVSLQSSSAFSRAAQVRALSEMAVNRVQSQIRDATTLNQTLSTPLNKRDTWASQPGAIRVYGPDGKLRSIYKLYSSDTMVTDDPDLAGDVPANWYERPAEFVDLNEPVRNGDRERYPIVDPNVASHMSGASGLVDGFSIRSDAPIEPGNPLANRAPMPVRWIYVLEDGTLCGLGDSRIDRETNPIIGRIAFWTDDETLKVNINTASPVTPNSYWDSPRAAGNDSAIDPTEFDYSWKQPSQNEYQRYPGHPATVSLLPILGDLGGLSREDYFKISPRYYWGGSEEGTKKINEARTSLLAAKSDRAYATVDELLFRSRPTGPQTGLTAQQIESLRFFLTASSRAPELNLFGQPRVSIWPIHAVDSDTRRTPFDRLIAFCSTIGGKAYYFTRENPLSATHDYEQIPRNKDLYAYLQSLTDTPVPGFGQSEFASKYGADRDQILTEIFDYIRTTNLNESYQGRNPNFVSYTPDLVTSEDGAFGQNSSTIGAGFVVPIEIGDTKGGGRFPAITEAGLWFVQHYPSGTATGPNDRKLQAMLVIKTTTPTFGYMPWVGPNMRFEITNATVGAKVGNNESVLFVGGTSKPIWYPPQYKGNDGMTPGGYEGAAWTSGSTDLQRVQEETPFFGVLEVHRCQLPPSIYADAAFFDQARVLSHRPDRHPRFEGWFRAMTKLQTVASFFDLGDTPDRHYLTTYLPLGYSNRVSHPDDEAPRIFTHSGRFGQCFDKLHDYEPIWTNNEYDVIFCLGTEFLRTANMQIFRLLRWFARHTIEVDFLCYSDYPGLHRAQPAHSARHTSTGAYPSHFWTQGLAQYYFLTGDEDAREVITALAEKTIWYFDHPVLGGLHAGLNRELGWAVLTLVSAYEATGEERFDRYALKLIRSVMDEGLPRDIPDLNFGHTSFLLGCRSYLQVHEGEPESGPLLEWYLKMVDFAILCSRRTPEDPAAITPRLSYEFDLLERGAAHHRQPRPGILPGYAALDCLAYAYERTGKRSYLRAGLRTLEAFLDGNPGYFGSNVCFRHPSNEGKAFAMTYRTWICFFGALDREEMLGRYEYPDHNDDV